MSSSRLEWSVAGCVAGWAVARLTAADRFRPLEQVTVPLLALTPHAAVAAGVAALLLRGKGPRAPAALAGAALAAVVAPRAIPRRQPTADGPVLRVLTVNLLTGRAAGGQLVELVRSTGADVLFLQELDEDAVSRLKQAGLRDPLPHPMAYNVGDRPLGSRIYAPYPLPPGPTIRPSRAPQATPPLDPPPVTFAPAGCVH